MSKIVETSVDPGTVQVTWFEQNHFVLKIPGADIIHIDPFVSRVVKPEGHIHPKPLVEPHECIADAVFLTHDHRDHTDPYTILPMLESNPDMVVYGPEESRTRLAAEAPGVEQRIHTVHIGETLELGSYGVDVVYAMPTGGDGDVTHLGYVYRIGELVVYMVGDTRDKPEEYTPLLETVAGLRPDLMIVPINDGYRNPGPRGATRLVEIVDPRRVVPCHFGCFTYNTIDPTLFIDALPAAMRDRAYVMERGESLTVS